MGNCHTRPVALAGETEYSAQNRDFSPDVPGRSTQDFPKTFSDYLPTKTTRGSSCSAVANLDHQQSLVELSYGRSSAENAPCPVHEDAGNIVFMRSYTPPSDGQAKTYFPHPHTTMSFVQGASSTPPIGKRPCSSLSTESRHLVDRKFMDSNSGQLFTDSRNSSYSASQVLKLCASQPSNPPCHHTAPNYSGSGGASLTYGHSADVNCASHCSSLGMDSDVNKVLKSQQKMFQRQPQHPQKYLIHHPMTNSPRHSIADQMHTINSAESTRLGRNTSKNFVAIFDYQAHSKEDLSVRRQDRLVVLDKSDSDWWLVENPATSCHGYVPSAYLAEEGSVEVYEWYFREISRKDSERLLLLNGNVQGTFLIRESETTQGALSLSVRDHDPNRGDIVNHYKIKPYGGDDGAAVCITSKKGFPNLVALVRNYTEHADGLCCRLTNPCPRPPPVLTDLSKRTKDHWEIPRSQLVLQEKLGNGQFGEVWKGEWNGTTPVAVKTMRPGTMSKQEFLKEARIMKTLNHPRLVRLYAVVTTEPIFIVTELMSNGSLLQYLRSDAGKALDLKAQVDIMAQIADGMSYLEAKELVHRDLAARNVLVGESNEVKVADFGLARQIDHDTEAYNAKQGAKFPIKWTAPEAALLGQFTVKSDVWSYGVVLYEIITRGQVPFPSMANTEILQQVSDGYRMPCPNSCPAVIYAVMLRTWEEDPTKRPSFSSLCTFFEDYFVTQEEAAAAESGVGGGQIVAAVEEQEFAAAPQHQFLVERGARRSGGAYPFMASPARLAEISARSSPAHSFVAASCNRLLPYGITS